MKRTLAHLEARMAELAQYKGEGRTIDELAKVLAIAEEEAEERVFAELGPVMKACGDLLAEPYDIEMFPSLTDGIVKQLVGVMSHVDIRAPSDRLHAQWARDLAARLQRASPRDLEELAERLHDGGYG